MKRKITGFHAAKTHYCIHDSKYCEHQKLFFHQSNCSTVIERTPIEIPISRSPPSVVMFNIVLILLASVQANFINNPRCTPNLCTGFKCPIDAINACEKKHGTKYGCFGCIVNCQFPLINEKKGIKCSSK
eukprot:NODE_108_length_19701_cov_0.369452.p13 type:complete len:130 gc:universal NODE_108_length_19701_cov_0.369452:19244-19633(+)